MSLNEALDHSPRHAARYVKAGQPDLVLEPVNNHPGNVLYRLRSVGSTTPSFAQDDLNRLRMLLPGMGVPLTRGWQPD